MLALACCTGLSAQTASSTTAPDAPEPTSAYSSSDAVTLRDAPRRILQDERAIWTSPIHIRAHDLEYLLPLAAATGAGIATDHHTMASVVSRDKGFNQANVNASNVLVGGLIAAPVALYGIGHVQGNGHAEEAGLLGGEALLNGLVVQEGMKLVFRRERPVYDNAHGNFFNKNAHFDSSFPSSHSIVAWSTAAVLAREYPSLWKQAAVYSVATGVSLTRVLGQEHFPTDVLVGSAAGWLIGNYVFRAHHRHGER